MRWGEGVQGRGAAMQGLHLAGGQFIFYFWGGQGGGGGGFSGRAGRGGVAMQGLHLAGEWLGLGEGRGGGVSMQGVTSHR